MELKVLDDYIRMISNNPLYRCGANGDKRLMASLCMFFRLNQQFSFANYALIKADNLYNNIDTEKLTDEAKNCLILFNIEHSILAYNSCYDTVLQIVYFAFHFAKDFHSEKQYLRQLSRCKWKDEYSVLNKVSNTYEKKETGLTFWFSELTDEISQSFFAKLSSFYGPDSRGIINQYANAIKHKGGISISLLNSYIPDCSIVETPVEFIKEDNKILLKPENNNIKIFDTKIFYPEEIDFAESLEILKKQNTIIYEFVDFLFNYMGLNIFDSKSILAPNFTLPFYYKKNGTEQDK